jgi:hypothetical protein
VTRCGHPHRHGEHHARTFELRIAQQMECADGADHESRGEIGSQHHMHETIGEGWIEDHLPPVGGHELTVRIDGKAGRRLHPGVRGENPECRDQRADGDHHCREEVQPVADALEAEQHDAEEAGLKEKRRQHLIGHQRADDRAGFVGEHGPVGAELVRHHDAGHDAHAEGDGKNLQPVIEQVDEDLTAGPQPQRFEDGEIAGKPDGEGRKHDVKAHRERKLQARQRDCVETVEHRGPPKDQSARCYNMTAWR